MFDKGTHSHSPTLHHKKNVGHKFNWEQSGHQEDEPHFQLSGKYNTRINKGEERLQTVSWEIFCRVEASKSFNHSSTVTGLGCFIMISLSKREKGVWDREKWRLGEKS